MASLFQACKAAVRNKQGGTFNIGGYDIDIEMYTQQDIQDDLTYDDLVIGDDDESKIVLFADNTITIPEGYLLTPVSPKKSLVIFCNNIVNNGTISMYQKAPNVLPHDYYIIQGSIINSNTNIVIPAYAKNSASKTFGNNNWDGANGNNGTNRNCGSGGTASSPRQAHVTHTLVSGSGYAFGGGAGTGNVNNVDSIYSMRGSDAEGWPQFYGGGVGNPAGKNSAMQKAYAEFGCGGRVIIFCYSFTNNGTINVNGTSSSASSQDFDPYGGANSAYGGASGAGAVDIFYTTLNIEGNIEANGGIGVGNAGNGGNGSITLTQWNLDKVIKEERKMFTKNNWVYLFSNYSQRLREDVI